MCRWPTGVGIVLPRRRSEPRQCPSVCRPDSGGSVHLFPPRRGLAALAALLAVATLAAPARAATYRADIVTSISDPKGDVTDQDDAPLTEARADVTAATVEYRPGEIAFGLTVAQAADPRTDPNWADG